ncbi:MAG: hypothetical protein L6Q55_14285 [Azonexus sp.]|nr:hypothetical protein [Azonexus sp.]MCK6413571.1 hypothetical protein [Azonexus sp.]
MCDADSNFAADLAAWQNARRDELAAADSWLGLAGLFWLEPGRNALGAAAGCPLQLPAGPAWAGEVIWEPEPERLVWQPQSGEPLVLTTDRAGLPTTVDIENWSFEPLAKGCLRAGFSALEWKNGRCGRPFLA